MDDGFQHRYVEPKINIVMIDATRPVQHDRMLPAGSLRDLPEQLHRAHYFIVTKCPERMAPIDRRILRKVLIQVAYQRVYFTRFESFMPQPLYGDEAPGEPLKYGQRVIALSGIGNPGPFLQTLRGQYDVVAEMTLDDHHVYKVRDMNALEALLAKYPDAVIVTTEKDAVKMTNRAKVPQAVRRALYYQPINISFIEDSATDFLQNSKKMLEEIKKTAAFLREATHDYAPRWASCSAPASEASPTGSRPVTPSTTRIFPDSPSRPSRASRTADFRRGRRPPRRGHAGAVPLL